MFSIVTSTLRLAASRWPVLLALYLAGWLARYLVIEVAALVGTTDALTAFLIMPVAILARLASFIGMFLVLRQGMPAFDDLAKAGDDAIDRTEDAPVTTRPSMQDLFLASVLPFFAFYAAWQFLAEDTLQYAASALAKINPFDDTDNSAGVLNLELTWASATAIAVAFTGRFLLKRYSARLPRWSAVVTVYLEAVWVYLTLFLISNYRDDFESWVANRAAMHWIADLRAALGDVFAPIGVAWDGIAWAIGEAGALVLLPVAWLALAGIVYGRALTTGPLLIRVPQNRYSDRVRIRYARVPRAVSRRFADVGTGFVGRWKPLANALTLVWRAGVVPMGIFVLAYTVIEAAGAWIGFGATRLIGAHDLVTWWMIVDDGLIFAIEVLLEPLRICLIAAGYDYCLRRLGERRQAAALAEPVSTTV
ncbi:MULTISPECIES: hypothetical protein [Cryobacterium]|uniref:hypothetical protein n=1 Tax=Cryobacterium TaxID=69578 RepID=UPI000CD4617E|nr:MULTISPECIES: hypothetical protein [Cryobacterium]POH65621.1 hypothetical protein C3B60_12115 [Cryobacterium zongtaii]TFC45321.1 hypothetical protein E3O57_09450 [Cryobacterium sp. TMN-39-2]TFC88596.1 hypothetical protein E3T19_10160 [Cryobacterium sp. TMT4-31]